MNEDIIYRQDAIDALDKHIDTFDAIDKNYLSGLRTAMSILKEMPSAQPENIDCGSGELVQEPDGLVKDLVKDCISRQQAIDAVAKWFYDVVDITESDGTATIFERLRELPSAQPERKKGKWISEVKGKKAIIDEYGNVTCSAHCSECGDWLTGSDEYACRGRFCPNCGARMVGESE